MNIFHPQYDNLFMMGMIEATGLGWEGGNQQARLVALYLHHRQAGSQAVVQVERHQTGLLDQARQNRAGERLDGGYRYIKLARMAYYVNKEVYLAALHRHIAELEQALPAAPADLVVSQ